ncbi:MAG: MFS transporter [Galactobacter sp.]|uniref:MFS transporter n=1 Tax=Galactobacter sp. TaxID=2676125 RepID=UPI0025B88DE9|nr:MFS transporter [Galactobacter sp.]
MTRSQDRNSTSWLWILIAAAVLTQTGVNLLRPVTTYKLLDFGAAAGAVGATTAAYAIIPLVVAIWLGRLTDRIRGLRLLLVSGALLLGLGGLGLALAPDVALVFVASALLGLGHLVFTITGQTAVARYSSPQRMDAGFGWFTAAFSTGQFLGPVLGGWFVEHLGVGATLWIGTLISAAGALPFLFSFGAAGAVTMPDGSARHGAQGDSASSGIGISGAESNAAKPTMWAILRTPGIPVTMLAALSLLSMLDILTAFLPLVGEQAGVGPGVVGTLLGLRAAASILCRIALPAMTARVGRRPLMLWCLFASGITLLFPPVALLLWSGTGGVVTAGVLLVIGGFFLGIGQPLTMSAISQAVPASWRGSALAVRLMGNRLGQVVIPALGGLVAAAGAAGAVWMCCGLLLVSGVAMTVSRQGRGD